MKKRKILTVNIGSSSLKLGVYEPINIDDLRCVSRASIDLAKTPPDLAKTPPSLNIEGNSELSRQIMNSFSLTQPSQTLLEQIALRILDHFDLSQIRAVGHRIVHGGTDFRNSTKITAEVICQLEKLVPLAPLHEPASLALLKIVRKSLPDVLHVACFDTTFHVGQPAVAKRFALPREFEQQGIHRYGFHGLSYEIDYPEIKQNNSRIGKKKTHCGASRKRRQFVRYCQWKKHRYNNGVFGIRWLAYGNALRFS